MNDLRNILDSLQHVQAEADKVPDLAKRIAELEAALSAKTEAHAKAENDLLAEMATTESLTYQVQALEVARDNAGFRADDAEDKLKKILSVVGVQAPAVVPTTEGTVVPFADTPAQPVDTPPATQPQTASSQDVGSVAGATGEPVVYSGYSPVNPGHYAYDKPNVETSAGHTSPSVSPSTDASPGDATLTEVKPEPTPDPYTRDGRQSSYTDDQGNRRRWNYTLSRWDTEAKEAGLGQTQLPSSSW